MNVSIKKEVAEELITYKLRKVQDLIAKILDRWNEETAEIFIKKAREGIYIEAENDAIEIRQLLLEEEKLRNLLSKLPLEG